MASTDYYDRHGDTFFVATAHADLSDLYARFLGCVPTDGTILEAGCGAGRDARAFKEAGYAVTAFDGSAKMAALARDHSGLPVLHLRFEDVAWDGVFDGIWACASLLHVPRDGLDGVLVRLTRALKPGGAFYMSFKYGETERRGERHFTDMTEPLLSATVARAGLTLREMWMSDDVRPDHAGERWVSAIALRPL